MHELAVYGSGYYGGRHWIESIFQVSTTKKSKDKIPKHIHKKDKTHRFLYIIFVDPFVCVRQRFWEKNPLGGLKKW